MSYHRQRIELHQTPHQILTALSEGNPGALNALMRLYQAVPTTDPKNALGGLGAWLSLDTLGIYGSSIYVLVNDVCERNEYRALALLRAHQLGYVSAEILRAASIRQDRTGGELLDVAALYHQVQQALGDFDLAGNAKLPSA